MTNLLTKHLDTWTTAPNGIKKLRELILELAVRGLLVPQNPDDEPASVLLEKIADEKAQLCAEGKIKKSAPLPKIKDDEKPFDLPNSWEWVKLPDISDYKVGKTPSTKNSAYWSDLDSDIHWVSIADMNHFGKVSTTKKKITKEAIKDVFKYEAVPAGSLLMSFKLTVGKISILKVDAFHNEAIISIQPYSKVNKNYLFNVLPCRALDGNTKKAIKGNTLNSDSLAALLIPLPPLAEQHRIVAKVDELMQLCDQLEQKQTSNQEIHAQLVSTLLTTLTQATDPQAFQAAWTRIAANFDSLFTTESSIEQLKQTILQLAVMGKLVEQEAGDEPASVLLEKIAQEKARLISEGKIKKSAPLPKISDDEKPFDLPDGWEWVRLNELLAKIGAGSTPLGGKNVYVDEGVKFLRSQNVWNEGLKLHDVAFITESTHEKMKSTEVSAGDLLFNITGRFKQTTQKFHRILTNPLFYKV